MNNLTVLLYPVYSVHSVLATFPISLRQRGTSYLQSDGTRKGERVREMQADRGEGENIKKKRC